MKIALYARVSKRTGTQDTENQLAQLREFARVRGWSIAHEYVDRFSREGVLETLNHLRRLSAAGVGYKSFTEQYLDSCGLFKDAVLAILAVIAKQERVRLSERTIAGLEKARRQGRIGGRPRLVLNRAKVMQLDEEGLTIREIAAETGISSASIHRMLKAHHRAVGDLIPV